MVISDSYVIDRGCRGLSWIVLHEASNELLTERLVHRRLLEVRHHRVRITRDARESGWLLRLVWHLLVDPSQHAEELLDARADHQSRMTRRMTTNRTTTSVYGVISVPDLRRVHPLVAGTAAVHLLELDFVVVREGAVGELTEELGTFDPGG